MARKAVEAAVFPEQDLGSVGHVLVPEGPWANGVQYGASLLTLNLILDKHRFSITVTLDLVTPWLSDNLKIDYACGRTGDRLQITLKSIGY